MNLTVQRFQAGDEFYSDKKITNNNPSLGIVGTFQAVFGQILDEQGERIAYSMERFDTLIATGKYEYSLYDSPANKSIVIRLIKDPQGNDISARELEWHPANFPYQLKGCLAPCTIIDVNATMGLQSRDAFNKIMALAGDSGTITYENYVKENA